MEKDLELKRDKFKLDRESLVASKIKIDKGAPETAPSQNETTDIVLTSEEIEGFKKWLHLNWDSVTWFGKYTKDFEQFWDIFFSGDTTIRNFFEKVNFSLNYLKKGPIRTWMKWFGDKFICYCFIHHNLSLYQFTQLTNLSSSSLSFTLRNFFTELYPKHGLFFNNLFQVKIYDVRFQTVDFNYIREQLNIKSVDYGSSQDEIMCDFELTLYDDWRKLLQRLLEEYGGVKRKFKLWDRERNFFKVPRYVYECLIFLSIGLSLIYLLKNVNEWYEKNLANYIKIFDRDYSWSKNLLPFSDQSALKENNQISFSEIERPGQVNFDQEMENIEERFETESDVMLSSMSDLPMDFSTVDSELSMYEEMVKGGYRDEQAGDRKVYRVMLKSSSLERSRSKLDVLLNKYKAQKVSKVNPGTAVPGGLYYNVYVTENYVQEFLENVQDVDESVLFLSKTQRPNPAGNTKVFIWVKKI